MNDASDANASGWYPDPAGVHHQRYWSGDAWTARVADAFGVTAAHHIEHDYPPPGGGPVRVPTAQPKAPTPSLSLVASTTEAPPTLDDAQEVSASIAVPEANASASATAVADSAGSVDSAPVAERPPPAGWYSDPSGIHWERSWDGNAWSALVLDRNRALSAHQLNERFPPPEHALSPLRSVTPSALRTELLSRSSKVTGRSAGGEALDGWHPDPLSRFRERPPLFFI